MGDSYPFIFLAALVLFLVLALLNVVRVRFRRGLRDLPGPRLAAYSRLWNFRNAAAGNAHNTFRSLHEKYGKIVRTGPNHVAIADPKLIPIIYGTNNTYLKTHFYDLFITPYAGVDMDSMFSTTDPVLHKELKQAVANKYSLSSMNQFEVQVNECNEIFTSIMHEYARENLVVDFSTWLQWYAFDVMGAISFNSKFGFMEQRKDVDDIILGIESGIWYGSTIGQVPELHPWLLGNTRLMKVLTKIYPAIETANPVPKVQKMVEDAIKRHDEESSTGGRSDFLALFRQEAEKSSARMPHRNLMNHLMNNLLAGSDTTAISLRAIFYYLLKNPGPYQKLINEIELAEREGRISKTITLTESSQLPYLQACIKEAMRLHPGVSFPLERLVPKGGLTIDDVCLPEGTIVGINAWVIHHDKSIFGNDTECFRPERWIEAGVEELKLMNKYFLSFGAGTRICIGKNISIMEMGKMVPQLLREFDLSWASSKDTWDITSHWFARQSGLLVQLRPRATRKASGSSLHEKEMPVQ